MLSSTSGVALVEAQGELLSQQLLPQFETYLDPAAAARMAAASGQPMDEAQHDLVREGVVVLLGMMAGHLQPGDNKVRGGTWLHGLISCSNDSAPRCYDCNMSVHFALVHDTQQTGHSDCSGLA